MASYNPYYAYASSRGKNTAYDLGDLPPQVADFAFSSSSSTTYPSADYLQSRGLWSDSQDTSYPAVDYLSQDANYSSANYSSQSTSYSLLDYSSQDTSYSSVDYSSQGTSYPSVDYLSQDPSYFSGDYSSQDTSYASTEYSSQGSTFSSVYPSPSSSGQMTLLPGVQYGDYHGAVAQPRLPLRSLDNVDIEPWNTFADVFDNAGNPILVHDLPAATRAPVPSSAPSLAPPPQSMPAREHPAATYITPPPSSLPTREPSPLYITPATASTPRPPREPSPEPAPRRTRSSKGKGKRQRCDDEDEDDEYKPAPVRRSKRARTQRETETCSFYATAEPSDGAPTPAPPRKERRKRDPAAPKPKKPKNATKRPSNSYMTALHDHRPVLSDPASYALAHGDLIKVFAPYWYCTPPAARAPYCTHADAAADALAAGAPPPALPADDSKTARLRAGASGWALLAPGRVLAGVRHVVRASVAPRFDEHVTPTRAQHNRGTAVSAANARHFAGVYEDVYARWAAWCAETKKPAPPELPELFTLDDVAGGTHEEAGLIMEIVTGHAPDAEATPVRW
ncbi:hypothetical protein PsYK624_136410 [Phanerochaete sordida]|uniref:Uncharacterized protein n=1 Tax=Phanerochaete sordida TaxID=48140 RepID=A0A9P3LJJ8_9APHY|nr:hypothetical protein PsYK624_136410 [Phanerochaete sordida]